MLLKEIFFQRWVAIANAILLAYSVATTFRDALGIAYRDAQTGQCFAWNNDNYEYQFFRCDRHLLKGDRFRVDVHLLGDWVDVRFSFKFRTTDTGFALDES